MNIVQIQGYRLNRKVIMAVSRDEATNKLAQEASDVEAGSVEKKIRRTSKRAASARTRKKVPDSSDEESSVKDSARDDETLASSEVLTKPRTRTRKKG